MKIHSAVTLREIDAESNVEVLREFSALLVKSVTRLQSEVSELRRARDADEGHAEILPEAQAFLNDEIRDQLSPRENKVMTDLW